jgi:hypothetical protein
MPTLGGHITYPGLVVRSESQPGEPLQAGWVQARALPTQREGEVERQGALVTLRTASAAPWPGLRDQEDEPVWTTAALGHATHVVSSNVRDFPPNITAPGDPARHVWDGIDYLEPEAFLALVWADDPTDAEE